jgi:hypothetical protein
MLAKGFVDEVGSHGVSDHEPKHGSVGSIEQVSPGQIEAPVIAQQLRHEYAVYELQGLGTSLFHARAFWFFHPFRFADQDVALAAATDYVAILDLLFFCLLKGANIVAQGRVCDADGLEGAIEVGEIAT